MTVRLLLDTCAFLWMTTDAPQFSPTARAKFVSPDNDVYLSVVSAWEIAVKHRLGQLPLPETPPDRFIPARRDHCGIATLPLDEESALYAHRLPLLHRDPFDRMLVCQAIVHSLTILTPDEQISQYAVRTLW